MERCGTRFTVCKADVIGPKSKQTCVRTLSIIQWEQAILFTEPINFFNK